MLRVAARAGGRPEQGHAGRAEAQVRDDRVHPHRAAADQVHPRPGAHPERAAQDEDQAADGGHQETHHREEGPRDGHRHGETRGEYISHVSND